MASVEAAISTVERPGPLARLWHWRYELGLTVGLALVGLASGYELGAAWLIAIAAMGLALLVAALALATVPEAAHRHGLVRHHAAWGQDWLRTRRGWR
jgi:hypothetical protein